MHAGHAPRVQTLAGALRRRLPAVGFPTASAVLDEAYARAESDLDFAQTVVIALLPVLCCPERVLHHFVQLT